MSLTKRKDRDGKNRWLVRIESPDPITGRRKRVTVGTYQTKREAERAERQAKDRRDRGTLLDPARTTVAEMLESWLATKASDVTPQTLAGYEITARLHLIPSLGSIRVQQLTPARLQAQYGAWMDAGMSARNIRGCHMRLSQALAQAVRFRLVPANVCDVVTPPRLTHTKAQVWDTSDAMTFLDVAETDTLSPLWHLLLLEGMRRGEGLGLRWQDVDLDRGVAHIMQTVRPDISSRGEPIIQPRTKTAAGARTVRLTARTLTSLKAHRTRWLERRMAADTWAAHDLIICTTTDAQRRANGGRPVNPNNVTRSFDVLVKRAGLPRITPHGLRHTHATMLLRQGVPAKIVSERLGHASIAITLDRYSHVLPDMQDSAADAMDMLMASEKDHA